MQGDGLSEVSVGEKEKTEGEQSQVSEDCYEGDKAQPADR